MRVSSQRPGCFSSRVWSHVLQGLALRRAPRHTWSRAVLHQSWEFLRCNPGVHAVVSHWSPLVAVVVLHRRCLHRVVHAVVLHLWEGMGHRVGRECWWHSVVVVRIITVWSTLRDKGGNEGHEGEYCGQEWVSPPCLWVWENGSASRLCRESRSEGWDRACGGAGEWRWVWFGS